jgi:PAS domain S-box-containing protein
LAPHIDNRFWQLLESVPDAMILSDQKGCIVLANSHTERLFGYLPSELVGLEIETLVPEQFRTAHREHRDAYNANPTERGMAVGRDLCARSKDGSEFPVEITLAPVKIRGKTFIWSALRNVGDRYHSIARIRQAMQQERLGGLISICAWCKNVRDEGSWLPLETYFASHSEVKFTHGICQGCLRALELAGGELELASHTYPTTDRSEEGESFMPKRLQKNRYMVVEHFKDAAAVYQRLWERGRILPGGLDLVSAWFDENVDGSYRLLETGDHRLLDEWMANWSDLIDFEVHPVITAEEAGEKLAAKIHSATPRRSAGSV